ncbi:hypothetical protein WBG78_28440 [Chryseolinea sp. T2]|uniref:hypothetical protein n=1 Tax=Chryseolinea sp. T2 TaxID=3129255 RepID=UPI00307727BE
MLVLACEIHIGQYVFKQIGEVEINSSYETLTDTAVITIPRRLQFHGKTIFVDDPAIFKKGDKVRILLGYGYDNKTEVYTGYLVRMESGIPTRIFFEDAAYLLKQTQAFNLSYPKLSISQLLKDILPAGMKYYVEGDIQLGKASFKKATAAQILKYLSEKFSINGWIRNDVLYVGLNYYPSLQTEHKFHFQRNVISNNLAFVKAEDIKYSVKATSYMPDNTKIEVEVGDKEGAERTIHFYNVDEATLTARATKALTEFKFDGYEGTLVTFGIPAVKHGDIVNLTDSYFKERSGRYIVRAVRTTFGQSGYRQELSLGEKV